MTQVVSDDNKGTSGAEETVVDANASGGTVSYESHSKLLGQMKKVKEQNREAMEKLAAYEAEKAAAEEAKLKETQQFQTLLEKREAELKATKEKLSGLQASIVTTLKETALERELGGVLNPAYLKFADMSQIQLGEDGQVDPDSLKACADKFRNEHPHLLKAAKPPLPGGAPKPGFEEPKPTEVSWGDAVNQHFGK